MPEQPEEPAVEPDQAPAVEPEAEEPQEGEPKAPEKDPRLTKAQNEAKNLRERLKAAEASLKEREDAEKTEAQLLADRVQAAEAEHVSLLKRAVLAESGLDPDAAEFVHGDDEESLLAAADRLKALIGTKATTSGEPPKTWPDAPTGPRGKTKPVSLGDQIAELEAAGKYAEASTLKARLAMEQVAGS